MIVRKTSRSTKPVTSGERAYLWPTLSCVRVLLEDFNSHRLTSFIIINLG
jgi:hypothetical protein